MRCATPADADFPHRWYKASRQRYLNITDYVEAWIHIQRAAAENDLQLLSPSVRRGENVGEEAWWLGNFIAQCDAHPDCDADLIAYFDLHFYRCDEDAWTDPGIFSETHDDIFSVVQVHGTTRTHAEWTDYVYERQFWVSETSCSQENGGTGRNNVDSCLAITGQVDGHGRGSLYVLDTDPRVS